MRKLLTILGLLVFTISCSNDSIIGPNKPCNCGEIVQYSFSSNDPNMYIVVENYCSKNTKVFEFEYSINNYLNLRSYTNTFEDYCDPNQVTW